MRFCVVFILLVSEPVLSQIGNNIKSLAINEQNLLTMTPDQLVQLCWRLSPYRRLPPTNRLPLTVIPAFGMFKLIGVDSVQQTLTVSGTFKLLWIADACNFENSSSATSSKIDLQYEDFSSIWHPSVMFQSSISDIGMLNNFYQYGYATITTDSKTQSTKFIFEWKRFGVFETNCLLDLRKFPFDSSACDFIFRLISSDSAVRFLSSENMTGSAVENMLLASITGQWIVRPLGIITYAICQDSELEQTKLCSSTVNFSFLLKRRPTFFVVNFMLPSLALVILNMFTFFVKPDIPDRISVSVGIVISASVFVTVVIQYLPQTPQFIFLSNYILLMTFYCALCTIESILMLWFVTTYPEKACRKIPGFRLSYGRLVDIFGFMATGSVLVMVAVYTWETIG